MSSEIATATAALQKSFSSVFQQSTDITPATIIRLTPSILSSVSQFKTLTTAQRNDVIINAITSMINQYYTGSNKATIQLVVSAALPALLDIVEDIGAFALAEEQKIAKKCLGFF